MIRRLALGFLAGAVVGVGIAVSAPVASAEPFDPTVDVTRPVLRYEPFSSPRTVKESRTVRSPREVRKAGR